MIGISPLLPDINEPIPPPILDFHAATWDTTNNNTPTSTYNVEMPP